MNIETTTTVLSISIFRSSLGGLAGINDERYRRTAPEAEQQNDCFRMRCKNLRCTGLAQKLVTIGCSPEVPLQLHFVWPAREWHRG